MKGKFIYVFGDGHIMTDRNGYNTITQAKAYARSYNRNSSGRNKIVNVLRK